MRLDIELVRAAEAVHKQQKRSVPRQIEYWAELGRAVEKVLDHNMIIAVTQGLAKIKVELAPSGPVSSTEVFAELEQARESGSLSARVTSSPVRYQASTSAPGCLEQIRPDGQRTVGRFRDGRFVPLDNP